MSNNNIYEQNLLKIQKLHADKKFDEAMKLVEEELGMPYTPSNFLPLYQNWKNILVGEIKMSRKVSELDRDEVLDKLTNGNSLSFLEGVGLLPKLPYSREDSALFKKALLRKDVPMIHRAYLGEYLVSQKVAEEFEIWDYLDNKIAFKPLETSAVMLNDAFKTTANHLDKLLYKTPSLFEMAVQLLIYYSLYHFPHPFEGDPESVAKAIFEMTDDLLNSRNAQTNDKIKKTIKDCLSQFKEFR